MTNSSDLVDPFCCDFSRNSGEVVFGTAPNITNWLLLEYNQVWHKKATEENDLPHVVQGWLQEQLALIPKSRLLFIKQSRPRDNAGFTFFVAPSHEGSARLYRFNLADYEELLGLDIASFLSGDPVASSFLYEEPIYLVCTNGRRDRCCAREGPALYQSVTSLAGQNTWQSTHLAGHRFAANLVTFPGGVFYGRLSPDTAQTLYDANERGELLLDHLRGRSCYDAIVQSAEQFLRQDSGQLKPATYEWQSTEALSDGHWAVTFQQIDGQLHRITLVQEETVELLVSCHPAKKKPVTHYRFERHDLLPV